MALFSVIHQKHGTYSISGVMQMMCAWQELLSVLPIWIRSEIDILGRDSLTELRLRINAPPELIMKEKTIWLSQKVTLDDLNFVVNTATHYSPWTATTISQGYITSPGGHRIGIGGDYLTKNGHPIGIRQISSLCIRVARDFPGIAEPIKNIKTSILILGAPGWGKTTFLRDLIRYFSEKETICVVDERGELFPFGFSRGKKTDIIWGLSKKHGIEIALRTMGPECIAVDEITAPEDCHAVVMASNCGVRLAATAHASSIEDFKERFVYKSLIENRVFGMVVILHRDRSFEVERMAQ